MQGIKSVDYSSERIYLRTKLRVHRMNWANYTRPVSQVKKKQHNFLSSDLYTPLALGISVFILQIFLLTMPSLDLRAQEQDLKFSNISIEDGLSHSKVNCIYQDSNGFLWFGT